MTCKAARRLKAILARPAGLFKEKARENQREAGGDKTTPLLPNSTKALPKINTRQEIAKIAGLGGSVLPNSTKRGKARARVETGEFGAETSTTPKKGPRARRNWFEWSNCPLDLPERPARA